MSSPGEQRQVGRPGPVPFALGDVLRLRKRHPCGGTDWVVVRLGADIGLKCQTCGRRVLLPRRELERRVRTFLARGDAAAGEQAEREGSLDAGQSEPAS